MAGQGVPRRSGLQIGIRSFLWAFCILLALMVAAGVLTRVIPAGSSLQSTGCAPALEAAPATTDTATPSATSVRPDQPGVMSSAN